MLSHFSIQRCCPCPVLVRILIAGFAGALTADKLREVPTQRFLGIISKFSSHPKRDMTISSDFSAIQGEAGIECSLVWLTRSEDLDMNVVFSSFVPTGRDAHSVQCFCTCIHPVTCVAAVRNNVQKLARKVISVEVKNLLKADCSVPEDPVACFLLPVACIPDESCMYRGDGTVIWLERRGNFDF